MEQHRENWSLAEWKVSGFGAFIDRLQQASTLDDDEFLKVFRGMRFLPGGGERRQGHQADTPSGQRRIRELASHLPRLVIDTSGRDRWTLEELLGAIGWRDAFGVRHAHQFPIDVFVQWESYQAARAAYLECVMRRDSYNSGESCAMVKTQYEVMEREYKLRSDCR